MKWTSGLGELEVAQLVLERDQLHEAGLGGEHVHVHEGPQQGGLVVGEEEGHVAPGDAAVRVDFPDQATAANCELPHEAARLQARAVIFYSKKTEKAAVLSIEL